MDNEKILELFNDLMSGKKVNGKMQLLRIYGAYEREREEIAKNKSLDDELRRGKSRFSIHRISDDMAIIEYHEKMFSEDVDNWFSPAYKDKISHNVYDSFDKALIALVAIKTGNLGAEGYIFKMLDMVDTYED